MEKVEPAFLMIGATKLARLSLAEIHSELEASNILPVGRKAASIIENALMNVALNAYDQAAQIQKIGGDLSSIDQIRKEHPKNPPSPL